MQDNYNGDNDNYNGDDDNYYSDDDNDDDDGNNSKSVNYDRNLNVFTCNNSHYDNEYQY